MLRIFLIAWALCSLIGYADQSASAHGAQKIIAVLGVILGILACFIAIGPFSGPV